jgi:hypothetical protein
MLRSIKMARTKRLSGYWTVGVPARPVFRKIAAWF